MTEPVRPPEPEAPMPKWVYAVGILLILVALGFAAVHLGSGGIPQHGPAQ